MYVPYPYRRLAAPSIHPTHDRLRLSCTQDGQVRTAPASTHPKSVWFKKRSCHPPLLPLFSFSSSPTKASLTVCSSHSCGARPPFFFVFSSLSTTSNLRADRVLLVALPTTPKDTAPTEVFLENSLNATYSSHLNSENPTRPPSLLHKGAVPAPGISPPTHRTHNRTSSYSNNGRV